MTVGQMTVAGALVVLGILALLGLLAVDKIITGGQVMSVVYVLLGSGTASSVTAMHLRAQAQQRRDERLGAGGG